MLFETIDTNMALNDDTDNLNYSLLNKSHVLQFIRVEKNSPGHMAICEIEVYINGKATPCVLGLKL